ncbi:MAG: serine/threonine protein kinase [Candidatus Brocadiae bacterium]|nr:serine/threonine protein kinase [Candidatus Brocadiia bacterium]
MARKMKLPSSKDPLLGKTLGGYRIIRCLGEGGMAVVYEAEQRSLRRRIALKVLPLDLARDTQFVARFRQEALAVAALKHPGIVQIYDVGEDGGYHFFSMELVDGLSLEDYVRRHGRMDVPTSLLMIRQAATALEHARQAGIVHRDIKPSNILLDRQGQAKIADLGLAKAAMDVGVRTRTRALLGTPHYMAPEQSDRATEVDTRADIYSLGVTWYHALAGEPPFDGQTPIEIIMQHHETPLPSLSAVCPDVPASVERVIEKMTAKAPADRYQTPAEVVAAVIACSREMPALARAPKAGAFAPGPRPPARATAASRVVCGRRRPLWRCPSSWVCCWRG